MNYRYKKQVRLEFDEAVEKVREELKKEGFGVLTEIDVKKTLKGKLDVEYEEYIILGACNPDFAHKALQTEKEIGLLLPCNIIIYVENGKTYVSAINPVKAMSMIENKELNKIALEVKEKLERVIDNIKETDSKKHWESVFETKNFNEVSWFQTNPKTSIDLILSVNKDNEAKIIDIGGGDSNLIDKLIELDFKNITVLDISSKALEKSQQRLGKKAEKIKWICSDIKEFETDDRFDIWHDRALFHFLTSEKDINKYIELVRRFLKPNGHLIIGTFSLKGPEKCSGLKIKQYSKDSMKKIFSEGFEHIKSFEEIHHTPFQTTQSFIWNVFKKLNGSVVKNV